MAITNEDLKRLALAIAPFIVDASKSKHSLASVELDPAKMFGLPSKREGAGNCVVAIGAGPSIELLKRAIELVKNPH